MLHTNFLAGRALPRPPCSARGMRTPLWWLRLDTLQTQWTDRFTGQSLRGAKVRVVMHRHRPPSNHARHMPNISDTRSDHLVGGRTDLLTTASRPHTALVRNDMGFHHHADSGASSPSVYAVTRTLMARNYQRSERNQGNIQPRYCQRVAERIRRRIQPARH